MAQLQFVDSNDFLSGNGPRVSFFSLKNDGDEAIVRFMHDSTADFDILTTHSVEIGGKFRRVNCLRMPTDPAENCPLCAGEVPVNKKFFVHLIQYSSDENGNIVAEPKVWERSMNYAVELNTLMKTYGKLSDSIFKIHRNGRAGDIHTTYSTMYCPPNVFPESKYPKDTEMFDDYKALGTVVADKSFSDLVYFMTNKEFPSKEQPTEEVSSKESELFSTTGSEQVISRPERYY